MNLSLNLSPSLSLPIVILPLMVIVLSCVFISVCLVVNKAKSKLKERGALV